MSYFLRSIKCIRFGVVGVAKNTCSLENYGSFFCFIVIKHTVFLGILGFFFHIYKWTNFQGKTSKCLIIGKPVSVLLFLGSMMNWMMEAHQNQKD